MNRSRITRGLAAFALVFSPWLIGCGGHEARTLKMRTALDEGDAHGAIGAINEELDVKSAKDLPADIKGDNAILVLDRASIQQGIVQFDLSKHDFEAAEGDVPLWVRIGIHWGCPRQRGDDIVGRDVNLAARIVDLAGAGEVLCSEATAAVVGTLPGVEFEPLGPVFVRGIAEPVPIVRAVPV